MALYDGHREEESFLRNKSSQLRMVNTLAPVRRALWEGRRRNVCSVCFRRRENVYVAVTLILCLCCNEAVNGVTLRGSLRRCAQPES